VNLCRGVLGADLTVERNYCYEEVKLITYQEDNIQSLITHISLSLTSTHIMSNPNYKRVEVTRKRRIVKAEPYRLIKEELCPCSKLTFIFSRVILS
jgi:hypothetical protein